jgi:hypothetical protein
MGQKTNPIILRGLEYPIAAHDGRYDVRIAHLKATLIQFLKRKRIYVNTLTVNSDSTSLYLDCEVLFGSNNKIKLRKFRRFVKSRFLKKKKKFIGADVKNFLDSRRSMKTSGLLKFFTGTQASTSTTSILPTFLNEKKTSIYHQKKSLSRIGVSKFCKLCALVTGVNRVVLNIKKLNLIPTWDVKNFYSELKGCYGFKNALFAKESVAATYLLSEGKASAELVNTLFSFMFSRLHKRQHGRFFGFLVTLFERIFVRKVDSLLGIKILISGKLKGKTRASLYGTSVGCVPLQTLDCAIDYSYKPSFTLMGIFGFKLWCAYDTKKSIANKVKLQEKKKKNKITYDEFSVLLLERLRKNKKKISNFSTKNK